MKDGRSLVGQCPEPLRLRTACQGHPWSRGFAYAGGPLRQPSSRGAQRPGKGRLALPSLPSEPPIERTS
jgi:hypothetical protein